MPVFPSQNLNTQKICESYPQLLQIYSGSLVLDGTGSLKQFLNVTASYALNCNCGSGSGGSSLYTGSTYPITASWALTASYSENCNFGSSISQSFSASLVWTFNHNLAEKYVLVQAVDVNDNQLIPEVINLFDENTSLLGFSVPTAGIAIATRGGLRKVTIISGSSSNSGLHTGSYYPITSSWARNAITASYALNGGGSGTSGTSGTSGSSGTSGTSGLLNLTGSTSNGIITYNGFGGDVQNNLKVQSGYVILNQVSSSLNFLDDDAAAAGGVPLGGLYRNGNFILIRIK
jgi:hypothetical protein